MQRYESYKPSGVEWLGEIPNHWEVRRNIGVFDERKEANHPEMELLSVTIKRGIIKQDEITVKKDSSNEDKSKYKVVRKNDLAYNKMRMWQGAIGASDYDGIVSPAYVILQPRDILYSRYYHYLYRTDGFIAEANRHSYGLCMDMNSLRYEDFKTIYSPVPSPEDVERIVTFLDQKTAEIDEAIGKKKRLIELLQEQKNILINQAVTRGLNPNVPMRDSGIKWIGEIPAHWHIAPVYSKFTVQLGKMLDAKKITGRHLRPYLRNTDVQWDVINVENLPHMDIYPLETNRYTVQKGDLLVCEGGDVGRCSIWTGGDNEVGYQKALHRVRPVSDVDIVYFRFFMLAASKTGALVSGANTSTIAHFTGEMFRRMRLTRPPVEEQKAISTFLTEVENQVKNAVGNALKEIVALKELQDCIIASIVTGKIKI